MTLQQLRYILAIDRHRSFARAAEALGITQPTLSAMLLKLEEEIDVRLFERTNRSVRPTATGERIVRQAARAVAEADRIAELVAEEKGAVAGPFSLAVAPSIAPYLLPQFIRRYAEAYPAVTLSIREMKTADTMQALLRGETDAGIALGGSGGEGLLEIPLYTERFLVYLSDGCAQRYPRFRAELFEHEQLWILRDAQCMRESAFSFCRARARGHRIYEAGSIETLVRIVDLNGGFTLLPEMHLPLLTERQRANVRPIDERYRSGRRISLYVRADCIRQGLLNTVAQTLLHFMPRAMMEERLVRFGIRL